MSFDTRGYVEKNSTHPEHKKLVSNDTDISVAEIFGFVKKNDAKYEADSKMPVYFSPKPSSVVLNEDGTPKVMYRGDSTEFYVFDRKKSRASNLYGRGFYFTDSKPHAEQYGNARDGRKILYSVSDTQKSTMLTMA